MFERIRIQGWRQFEDLDISFHPQLTVITGENGAGKTTLLNLLSRHFGWSLAFVSTPIRRRTAVEFFSDYWDKRAPDPEEVRPNDRMIGSLEYLDGRQAQITIPEKVEHSYQATLVDQQAVDGLFVSSHRPMPFYQKVESIPTELNARTQMLNQYLNELRSRTSVNYRVKSPTLQIKQALISLATFGYGNRAVRENQDAIHTFESFEQILRNILPSSLGFSHIEVELPELMLVTESGRFSFDAVSGGVSALIDVAWQLHMYALDHDKFVVLIDEPENHLHPELQRTVFPNLLQSFHQAQFVVTTHSPFIVSSVPESNVYALTYTDERRVVSTKLDLVNRAGSSSEILRTVLGVPVTLPVWVEERLSALTERFSGMELDEDTLGALKSELAELGLERMLPPTIESIVSSDDND